MERRSELSVDLEQHKATVGQLTINLDSREATFGLIACRGS
jgi:hypothetical protein